MQTKKPQTIYLQTNKIYEKIPLCKLGKHGGGEQALNEKSKTPTIFSEKVLTLLKEIPEMKICYIRPVADMKEMEKILLKTLKQYRYRNENGKLTKWLKLSYKTAITIINNEINKWEGTKEKEENYYGEEFLKKISEKKLNYLLSSEKELNHLVSLVEKLTVLLSLEKEVNEYLSTTLKNETNNLLPTESEKEINNS